MSKNNGRALETPDITQKLNNATPQLFAVIQAARLISDSLEGLLTEVGQVRELLDEAQSEILRLRVANARLTCEKNRLCEHLHASLEIVPNRAEVELLLAGIEGSPV